MDLGQIQHLPQSIGDFRQILRLNGISQVESFHQLFVVVFVLLRGILRDENNIFRHRFPECFALHAGDIQRLLQCDVVHFKGDSSGGEVRIVNDVYSRKFTDRVENNLHVIGHFQCDWSGRQRLQFRRSRRKFTSASIFRARGLLVLFPRGFVDLIQGSAQFLHRYRA